jgi:regulator of protease activity HflC (stomatin/prohibitin superfamily)
MFDKIFEIIQACFEALVPFVVLYPFERGLLCRLGTYKRELGPGFHWVIPFHVDVILHEHTTPRTMDLIGLATTTRDGKSVGFDAIVTWQISSMEKALLGVTELHDALRDTCVGLIGTHLAGVDWEAIRAGTAVEELTSVCRKRGWRWGVEISAVQLSGISLVKNFRVTGSSQPHVMHLTPNPGL